MLTVWAALAALLWWQYAPMIASPAFADGRQTSAAAAAAARVFLALNAVFITYFWLNGVKDLLYVVWYYIAKRRLERSYLPVLATDVSDCDDRVAFVYCTCNDFDGDSLAACLKQTYRNAEFFILDDSYEQKYADEVDAFAAKHAVKVVRRADRRGFKAGNLNHFLQSDEFREGAFRYFVILDSDEIIPHDFAESCLRYFKRYDNVGIVQAGHIATRNRNFFMKLFHIGVNSHWNTYQTMKHRYGFSSLLGHGAMVSAECYEKAGGFPEMVAEDLCLSIAARNCGYVVAYAPDIVCAEEYPVDYAAFKKRHSKWTQGNMEFIKGFTGRIMRSEMKWYEKADIVLFTYNLPLSAVFAFFIVINIIILPLMGVKVGTMYPLWMTIPTVLFFVAPMLNDIFFWMGRLNIFRLIFYCAAVVVLYGSMFFITFRSSFLGLFGRKARFIVTPKRSRKTGFWAACRLQYGEIVFSTLLIAAAALCAGDIWQGVGAVILIALSGYLSVFLPLFSNRRYDADATAEYDGRTARVAVRSNRLARSVATF